MYYFISVNYNSSEIVSEWIASIKEYSYNNIIIIDNYSNELERNKMKKLSKKLDFVLIESNNIGYGAALNKGIDFIRNKINNIDIENIIIFAGNLDLKYKNIPESLPLGKFVYIPKIYEGKRNRNPFLTKIQKKIMIFYSLSAITKSSIIYYIAISFNKLLGFIPSEIWAVHGALFCFNYSLVEKNSHIFNDDSFLYGEELEFASYMEYKRACFVNSDIIAEHNSHITTQHIVTSIKKFLELWVPSFRNWIKRWGV